MSAAAVREPIAVVGIGCRFPGGVVDPASFWRVVRDGVDAITEIPADRFDAAALPPGGSAQEGFGTRWGGFLDGIDRFDAGFFGLSPREADRLDPQQRLLLETTWEALEDAGQPAEALRGARAGVFVGLWLSDFEARLFADPAAVDFHMTTGSGRYAASGRISYVLGLQGPSLTVDTACSSSLVAVHLACRSLWGGECAMALAGGANVILQPHITIAYSGSAMMAPDGRCKFGDARADGYVRSEGAAMLLLKPLARARADGDRVYAVILGSAVNNDGRSGDFMATPARAGQEHMLRLAYCDAGIPPSFVAYVEAHGTGTAVGDPVELGALADVLADGRPPGRRCAVGSVKTNFGHTEGAAGVAGLIKAALVLHHRTIPPNLHLSTPSPRIPWDAIPLEIPRERIPLPSDDAPAYAGVSAFGIAGTNAHVVLGEAPGTAGAAGRPATAPRAVLVPLSARSPGALRAFAEAYLTRVVEPEPPALGDLAFTAACRRSHHEHRLALVAEDHAQLEERLRSWIRDSAPEGAGGVSRAATARPRLVFVFPGQGSQWLGMGRELLDHEPVFRRAVQACEAAMRPLVGWSLEEQLRADERSPAYRLDQIDVIQPVLVSIDIALAALWRSWGIEPDAVVGHSMGEVAAAHAAGALDLDDAMRVICLRSKLLRRVRGKGAMAVVELPHESAAAALAGYEAQVSVAASNSPRSTILSGDPAALRDVLDSFERQEVFCRWVNVDVASHSPQVDPLRDDLLAALRGIEPRPPAVLFYSTVLGRAVEGAELDPVYWARNLRQPVLFSQALRCLLDEGHAVFLEVSPHPVLLPAVQQTLQHAASDALALGSLRRNEKERLTLLQSLGEMFVAGCPVEWRRLCPAGRLVGLPTYPWQRERFWFEPSARPAARRSGSAAHPLLTDAIRSATGQQVWHGEISTALAPYLAEHRVQGQVVLPAAVYLEIALAAAESLGHASAVLEGFSLEEAILPGDGRHPGPEVQVVVEPDSAQAATLQVFSRAAGPPEESWTRNAHGRIVLSGSDSPPALLPPVVRDTDEPVPGTEHYRAMMERGLGYGESFRTIKEFWRAEAGVVGCIRLPEPVRRSATTYRIHPAMLDGCLQLLLQTLNADDPDGAYLPVAVRRLRLYRRPDPAATLWARALRGTGPGDLYGDVSVVDGESRPVLALEGVAFRCRATEGEGAEWHSNWLYTVEWERQGLNPPVATPDAAGVWLLLGDGGGVAAELAARLGSMGGVCIVARPATAYRRLAEHRFEVDPRRLEDFERLLAEVASADRPLRGIVHLWSLQSALPESASTAVLDAAQAVGTVSVLHLVQALLRQAPAVMPRLWLVTRGAQPVGESNEGNLPGIAHAPIWGMAGAVINEHPVLRCTCVDLDAADGIAGALAGELLAGGAEDRVGYRCGERYVARLVRQPPPGTDASAAADVATVRIPAPYRVVATRVGVLDGLRIRPTPRRRPGRGEVEIEVRAVGVNFMNVMSALGTYPGYPDGLGPLGIECAGVIAAVGEGAEGYESGDEVVAFAFDCLATHAVADARLVAPKPRGLSFERAATMPIAFLTASYALEHLGRLAAGERVLIHSAGGGVGLAAIQLAQRLGAEIFATAGAEEKREFLRSLGIRHVFDSRSLAFADEIMARTEGEGVDVVLNSLAGEAIAKGLSVLRPFGRFLELGKRDIYDGSRFSLAPFRNQLSYFAIDLDRGARERPALLGAILRGIMAGVEAGELAPLPEHVFPVSRTVDAFREMAQARHTGKIVISMEAAVETTGPTSPVRPDATYLITGGLGALGLAVAGWMVEGGARHLVLLGRSEASEAAREVVSELESAGARVVVEPADVSREADLVGVLERIDAGMPPLRGVVHAAGLLADATVLQLDRDRLAEAMAPKVSGAWHLHRLTLDRPLDFFVLFSSVAALLGLPGQANYAAANAFLDALAHARRMRGLPALSIGWGPWGKMGLAAERADRGQRLATKGLRGLNPSQGIAALGELLRQPERAHVAVARLDVARWCAAYPAAAASPLLSRLREATPAAAEPERSESRVREWVLAAKTSQEREALLETHLRTRAAQVLRLAPERLALNQPLKALGMDSLMTLELRNRLEADLRIRLSATVVWNHPTVVLLARHLAERLAPAAEVARRQDRNEHSSPNGNSADASLVEPDRAQLESLLDRELAAIDDLLSGS